MIRLSEKPYSLNNEQIETVRKIVCSMTLKEKIGQLFFVIGPDENQTNLSDFIKKYQPGGIMYRPASGEKIRRELAKSQAASKIPMFTAANLESGGNGIATDGTWVGMPMEMAATDDSDSSYQLGKIAGSEARATGTNMSFAPIVDIDNNFRNPIMNVRTCGSDMNRVIRMTSAQAKGLEEEHVIPVIKHFPGDGVDERDQHLLSSVNSLSVQDWMNSYGKIYQHFIDNSISTIMIAHIMQPAWERKLNPNIKDSELRPASSSKYLINGLLRKKLNFNGLTLTDATAMIGYNVANKRSKLLPETINAGIDMILFNKNIDEDYQFIQDAIEDGRLSEERLTEAVTRIIATKLAQKVMDDKLNLIDQSSNLNVIGCKAHHEIAAKIADKAVTLVKDRDNLLPITPQKYPRIRLYVLGDNDDGGFKEGGHVTKKFVNKLKERSFEVSLYNTKQLNFHEIFEEGVADMKSKFDLALYVANVETASNQTTTRLDWIHLMAANAPWFMRDIPTVFVSTANPYHLFDIPMVSTFVNAYTGNEETINAVLDKLTGKSEFKGKSPVDPFCGRLDTKL